ncbi:NUDIX domain-containing protein [Patescibacteria group bacterium]
MSYLFTLTDKDIFKNPEFSAPDEYEKRMTVKAVAINNEGKCGFVTNPVHGFYLLAGGGAESDDLEQEIKRECDEELDVEVEVIGKIGESQECRNRDKKECETTCFLVKVTGELKEDTRTEDEKCNGLCPVWLDEDEAVKILKEQKEKVKRGEVDFYNTAFNIIRDAKFFMEYLQSKK